MKKILIIDYDQNSLASLQAVLAAQGYQVVTAADGQTGWDKYNKESPDLVLMEAMLPKVHGFELCQRITSERNSQATVFIMTGVYKDRVYRTEALRTYGASEYFEKPLKMAELMASVEAVLGKPEAHPAEARPAPAAAQAAAQPGPEVRTAPAPAEPRRRERPKSDDSIFDLPEDLDRLSKELPKARKPAPVHPEPDAEPRFDALADELLKTVLSEPVAPKTVQPRPAGGNGNGNNGDGTGPDIDQFLKSALAGLDLSKEKVKVAKPAPPAVAPVPPAPVKDKPAPAPLKAAVPEIKPTPPPRPPAPPKPFVAPATVDMKNTLTPGDPGSDVSPFFTLEKPRPAAKPVERVETLRHEPARREPERREPIKVTPPAPAPAPAPDRSEESVIAAAGIFQDIAAPAEKKSFPTALVAVLGVVAVAAVAFVLLRPKHPAPVQSVQPAVQTVTKADVPAPPVEEPPPPVVKPTPKQKAQPQAKPADTGPAAILPTDTTAPALPLPGTAKGPGAAASQPASGTNPNGLEQAPAKTTETAPPAVKTEANPPQNTAAETASNPGSGAPAPATTAAAPVNPGDLVELAAVTEQPKILKRVEPAYPPSAQRLHREGNITINALIDEKGNVIDTGILKGIQDDLGLAKAAETAVRKWKFQPAVMNGVPVKVWKPFVIVFKAAANPAK